jgi:drug/metabolite transporter (DMT)-like permease
MADLFLGVLLGLLSSALFAGQNVLIRGQREGIGALIANSVKMWTSLLLMLLLVILPWRIHEFVIPGSALVPLALSVLFGGAFGDAVYLSGQERIGVSRAFPISNTYPIVTYMITILLLNNILEFSTTTGIILAILGVVLVSREISIDVEDAENKPHDWRGFFLASTSSIMYAFATVFMEIGVADMDPIDANLFRTFIGSLAMLPVFSYSLRQRRKPLSKRALRLVSIAGLLGYGIASLLYVASIKLVGATIGAVIGSTAPLFALPISIVYLKERVTWKGLVGTMATIIGIWLVVVGA